MLRLDAPILLNARGGLNSLEHDDERSLVVTLVANSPALLTFQLDAPIPIATKVTTRERSSSSRDIDYIHVWHFLFSLIHRRYATGTEQRLQNDQNDYHPSLTLPSHILHLWLAM